MILQSDAETLEKRNIGPISRIDLNPPYISKLTDADPPAIKELAEHVDRIGQIALVKLARRRVVPTCEPWMSLRRVVSGQPNHVGSLRMKEASVGSASTEAGSEEQFTSRLLSLKPNIDPPG